MDFQKYQHIERIGSSETDGIELGMCHVFPKIDGTNSQVWWNNGPCAGSRNRQLSLDYDNQGFYKWVWKQENITRFLMDHSEFRLYGEWLVPHTLKTYDESAWRKFYVFDVMVGDNYLPYDEYKEYLDQYDIEYIPPICKVKNPTIDRLIAQMDKNGYLIKDGEGTGEGVVIKNYDYKNRYGRVTWAKIVRNDFKAKHSKNDTTELTETAEVEVKIVDKYVSLALVEKEFAKIKNESGWTSRMIPRLLNTVFYCLVSEEAWNFVKEFKNPKIDFKRLLNLTIVKVKELKPELF